MSNRIQPIKFLNWLFLRIKPSEYDPSKPLTFGGGFDGTSGDNLEQLETIENNLSEMGDQVQGIEERIPGHITTRQKCRQIYRWQWPGIISLYVRRQPTAILTTL